MSSYEIIYLGVAGDALGQSLLPALAESLQDFGLKLGDEVGLRFVNTVNLRDQKATSVAIVPSGCGVPDIDCVVSSLRRDGVAMLPVVRAGDSVSDLPAGVRDVNALFLDHDEDYSAACGGVLELLSLLRRQRRLFLSYRRDDSRDIALQLFDALSGFGFEVFLDTHSIRAGEVFQSELWRQMVDSDILLMLDTPDYFNSRWTNAEWGRAHAAGIHILQIIWPSHTPLRKSSFSHSIQLDDADLCSGLLAGETIDIIRRHAERLRSRSIAARLRRLVNTFEMEMGWLGATLSPGGHHGAISVELQDGRRFWAYPAIGIPTALALNDVARRAENLELRSDLLLIFDHHGINEDWSRHLRWLDQNLKCVRAVPAYDAGWILADELL